MPLPLPDLDVDLSGLGRDAWLAKLDALGEEHGYFAPLGADHCAVMIDAGPKLLVTFETEESAMRRTGGRPRGFDLVMRNGWSLLALICRGDTWFRDERVYRFIDRQTDDGFFEDFEQVLFYGNHTCGYAAAAFSVAAPDARVLALRPAATMDPAYARWDRRHMEARRLDFNSRYGFAPDMIEAAHDAYIVADMTATADGMHAALFRRPNATILNAEYAGPRIEYLWDAMGIATPMIEAAMAGRLTPARFGKLWRARRSNTPYLRGLLKRLERAERPDLARRLCRYVIKKGPDTAYFTRALVDLGGGRASAAE